MDMDVLLLIGAMMEDTLTPRQREARNKLAAALMSDMAKELERDFRREQAFERASVKQPKDNSTLINRVLATLEQGEEQAK